LLLRKILTNKIDPTQPSMYKEKASRDAKEEPPKENFRMFTAIQKGDMHEVQQIVSFSACNILLTGKSYMQTRTS
jgi:hypothetical protein